MAEQGNKPESPAKAGQAGQAGEPSTKGEAAAPGVESVPGQASMSAETASLLALIDKLTALLERSDLIELEVEAGESSILLRKPGALHQTTVYAQAAPASVADPAVLPAPIESVVAGSTSKAVRAPLTGIFYAASSPSTPPYVTVGQQVAVGQIIGLIEAMKLFNEIKSDAAGRVIRIVAETGKLVKAKQTLIEVEP